MNKKCLLVLVVTTVVFVLFFANIKNDLIHLNNQYVKALSDKSLSDKYFLNAMNFNGRNIGDINIVDIYGKRLILKEIEEMKNINSKIVVFLRPTDCSICSNDLMNIVAKRKDDNKFIMLTTNENMHSVRVISQNKGISASIYCLSLTEAHKIMDNIDSGPALFQLDNHCSIFNLLIAKNRNEELINEYIYTITK